MFLWLRMDWTMINVILITVFIQKMTILIPFWRTWINDPNRRRVSLLRLHQSKTKDLTGLSLAGQENGPWLQIHKFGSFLPITVAISEYNVLVHELAEKMCFLITCVALGGKYGIINAEITYQCCEALKVERTKYLINGHRAPQKYIFTSSRNIFFSWSVSISKG